MKKKFTKMALLMLILTLIFTVGCQGTEEETSTEESTETVTDGEAVTEDRDTADDDAVLNKLEEMKNDENVSAHEILTFVDEQGEDGLNEVEQDSALAAVRARWNSELEELQAFINRDDVKTALAGIQGDGIISQEELAAIDDEEVLNRLNQAYDAGYHVNMKGGQPVAEVNFEYYKDLNTGSFAWRDYFALKATEQQHPWKVGNKLNIEPKELVERLQAHEKYFNSYGNSELSLEMKDEFNVMLDALMKGLPETPISDEDGTLKAEFKEAYELAATEDTTILGQTVSRYLEVLKVKDWKVDQEVLDGATRLTDNAGNLIQRTK